MAVTEQIACDGPNCGAIRKQANHWFLVDTGQFFFQCVPLNLDAELPRKFKPVCGQACAQKLFEQWMQKASGEQSKGSDKP